MSNVRLDVLKISPQAHTTHCDSQEIRISQAYNRHFTVKPDNAHQYGHLYGYLDILIKNKNLEIAASDTTRAHISVTKCVTI